MINRRGFLGQAAGTTLGAAALDAVAVGMAPVAAAAAPRRRVDRDDPAENVRIFTRISSDLDPSRQGRVLYSGKAFGVLEDGSVVPFYGIEGLGSLRAIAHDDGAYRLLFAEFAVYTDLETGLPLRTWRNPVINEDVSVWHQRNGPVNYALDPRKTDMAMFTMVGKSAERAKGFRLPWVVDGDSASFRLDTVSKRPNPLDPAKWRRESSGSTMHISEHSQYFLSLADIENRKLTSLPFRGALQSVKPWHPWMLMGHRPGKVLTVMTSRKVGGLDALTPAVAAFAREQLGGFIEAPTTWTGAYVTANALFEKERQPLP